MTSPVPMIDVSSYNHLNNEPIQWPLVRAARYEAVMIKCTEGVDYVNPWLEADANHCHELGLHVGFYHFAHPGRNDPDSEARHAIDRTLGLWHDMGLALDLEITEGLSWVELADWAQHFHRAARVAFQHAPLYTTPSMLDAMPGAPWGERLWLPSSQRPRRQVWAWQMIGPIQVPGIQVPTDVGFLHPDA